MGEGWEKLLLDPWITASFLHSLGQAVLTKLIKILDSWWNLGSCSPIPPLVHWNISSEKERWVGRRGKKGGAGDFFQREHFFRNSCLLDSKDVFSLAGFVKNTTTLYCPTKKKVQSQRVRHDLVTEQQQQLLTVPRIWTSVRSPPPGDQPQLIQGIRRRDGLGDYLYANQRCQE